MTSIGDGEGLYIQTRHRRGGRSWETTRDRSSFIHSFIHRTGQQEVTPYNTHFTLRNFALGTHTPTCTIPHSIPRPPLFIFYAIMPLDREAGRFWPARHHICRVEMCVMPSIIATDNQAQTRAAAPIPARPVQNYPARSESLPPNPSCPIPTDSPADPTKEKRRTRRPSTEPHAHVVGAPGEIYPMERPAKPRTRRFG